MHAVPYVYFPGTTEEAFNFYAKTLGGKVVALFRFKDSPPSPMTPPAEFGDKVMHGFYEGPGVALMATDAVPAEHYAKPRGFDLAIAVDTPEEAERIFAAFSEGGEVTMPMQETFWAYKYGKVKDRFGLPWMVSANKPMGPQ